MKYATTNWIVHSRTTQSCLMRRLCYLVKYFLFILLFKQTLHNQDRYQDQYSLELARKTLRELDTLFYKIYFSLLLFVEFNLHQFHLF